MSSKVEIANLALFHIRNNNPIASFEEGSVEAITIDTVYEHCKKVVLEAKSWNFATTVLELTKIADGQEQTFPFLYAFAIPPECVRINDIINYLNYKDYTNRFRVIPYEKRVSVDRTKKIILTNEENPMLRYNIDVKNSMLFPQIFVECLSWYIAFIVAPSLTNDEKLRELCFQGYQSALQSAMVFDSTEDNFVNLNTCYYNEER